MSSGGLRSLCARKLVPVSGPSEDVHLHLQGNAICPKPGSSNPMFNRLKPQQLDQCPIIRKLSRGDKQTLHLISRIDRGYTDSPFGDDHRDHWGPPKNFFFLFMDVEKKIGLKSPKLHTQGPPGTCQGGLREYARPPPKTAKNRGILILRAHVSPHLGAEAWAQVVVALAARQPEPNNPHLRTREPTGQPSAPEPGSPPTIV